MAETRTLSGKLYRWCPTPYQGGTCGCGCGCTQPSDPDWPRGMAIPPHHPVATPEHTETPQ